VALARAHALFGDDEARKAILELRERVEANRQAAETAQQALQQALQAEMQEGAPAAAAACWTLVNQIEAAAHRTGTPARTKRAAGARSVPAAAATEGPQARAFDERLRKWSRLKVTVDGLSFQATPAEKREFDEAMAVLRAKTDFRPCRRVCRVLAALSEQRLPAALALYWLGNAQYATRSYKAAIEAYRGCSSSFPQPPACARGHAGHGQQPDRTEGPTRSPPYLEGPGESLHPNDSEAASHCQANA
jgi:TolA-binding protein